MSMTPQRLALTVPFIVAAVACDGGPVRPQRVGPPADAPSSPSVRLTGLVVEGDGKPVPGAAVTALSLESANATLAATTSDAAGAYTLSFRTPAPLHPIKVEGEGFEASRHYVELTATGETAVRRDLRLHRIRRVRAGEAITVTINADDPACVDVLDEWACRTIRIVNPGADYVRAWVSDTRVAIRRAGSPDPAASLVDFVFIPDGGEVVIEILAERPPVTATVFTASDWF